MMSDQSYPGRFAWLALFCFLGLWCGNHSGTATAAEKVVLQLKWKHQFQFAGYYAAVEQGYYREAGLDVELREGGPDIDFAQEVVQGRAQYVVALPSMLIRRNEGKPVVALAAILQHSPEVAIVPEASPINNPHQLAGKKVMMSPEDTPCLLATLQNEGVPRESVQMIPYDFQLDKFVAGEFDALGGYVTDEPFALSRRGFAVRLIQPRNYGVDFYGDCLFTSEEEVAHHGARVQAFLAASLKGWQYAMRHPDEVTDLIISKYHSEKDRDALRYEAGQMNQLMFSELIEIGHMNAGRWRHIGDTYVRLGMLRKDYSLDGFLYEPNAPRDLRWVWWTVAIFAGSTLLLTGAVAGLVRINRRIATAERLARESHSMLEAVLDAIPVGVFWSDRQGRFLGGNSVFASYVNLPGAEQVTDLDPARLPEGWRSDPEADREIMEKGQPVLRVPEKIVDAQGEERHFQKSKAPLRADNGSAIGILCVVEDVTALEQAKARQAVLDERIRQAEKFESLQRLTGGVCHHFNNILQAVLGQAELARGAAPEGSNARARLDKILEEMNRAVALGHVLLASTGTMPQERASLGLRQFLENTVAGLSSGLPEGQRLILEAGHEETRVRANADSLREVMAGLVANASESLAGASGEIILRSGRITCTQAYLRDAYLEGDLPEGEYGYIDIVDHGAGMTPQVSKNAFEPFFSTKRAGRGLGLAVALGIVRSHRGAIRIHSQPGKGTTVKILLPMERQE